jgi:peptidoglycan/LPS O-acetylase OafA/YrhL
MTYRKDVDGLRAVAVLAVLLFHAMPATVPGGSWGVDIFFVISGWLISGQIARDLEAGSFSLVSFYARRARRLLPALLIVLAACWVAGWAILLPQDFRSLGAHILSGALYVSNFKIWSEVGYFDAAAAMKPLLHLWSLGVEEQFYLVWPLLLIVAFRFRWIGPAIAAVTAASFLCSILSSPINAFFLPWNRFWELGLGALLALYGRDVVRFSTVINIVGIALIAAELAMPEGHSPWLALLPTIGATLVIATPDGWFNRVILSSRPAVAIGKISYQLYLWHWPPLVFARYYFGGEHLPELGLTLTALAFPLAIATVAIENAIRRAPLRLPALASGMVAGVLSVGILGALVVLSTGFPGRFASAYAAILETTSAGPAMRNRVCFLDANQPGGALGSACLEQGEGPLVLLWGDSHAAQLYPGLRALADERGWRVAEVTQSQCPFVPSIDLPLVPNCRSLNEVALEQIATLKPDLIIMATRWSIYPWVPDHLWKQAFDVAKLVNSTKGGNGRIVVFGSFPEWPVTQAQAVKAVMRDGSPFPERIAPTNPAAARATAARMVGEAGLMLVDPFDTLCTAAGCLTMPPGQVKLMCFDGSHLTPAGSRYFVRAVLGSLLRDKAHGSAR